jgi:Uma2 family endonuclease
MPYLKKAELIGGIVHLSLTTSLLQHGNPHFDIVGWLGQYVAETLGVKGGDNCSPRLDLDNEPQPDACIVILPENGGPVEIDIDGYIVGGPELVVEVAASSASYDLHDKLNAYRRNGVQEYIVWRVLDQAIDWFRLRESRYDSMQPSAEGVVRGEVLPGLWLDADALIRGDLAAVNRVVQHGIASPEHAAFVTRLATAAKRE